MTTIDRKVQPECKTIDKINYIRANEQKLNNDIPVYLIDAGTQEIVKIELIFNAGGWFQQVPMVASSTNSMLNEGTKTLSSAEIAEKLDFYGAFLQLDCNKLNSSVTLYSLNKYLDTTLSIVEDLIKNSIFKENQFATYLQKRKQRFIIESSKVESLARNKFNQVLYGENHPYAAIHQLSDFDTIKAQFLVEFHKKHYSAENCKMIIAGKINENLMDLLNKHFGGNDWTSGAKFEAENVEIQTSTVKQHFIDKTDAVQCSLRIGKILFNKHHDDFNSLDVVNTLFGGYFGSRLMANIREDKGYTYGIGSALISKMKGGHFLIHSEVGKDVYQAALKEIFIELKRLRTEFVEAAELEIVKNYMMGELLRSFDGPFALAASFRAILEYNLDYNYYDNYVDSIKNTNPDGIKQLAEKYLHEDTMYQVVAGVAQ